VGNLLFGVHFVMMPCVPIIDLINILLMLGLYCEPLTVLLYVLFSKFDHCYYERYVYSDRW